MDPIERVLSEVDRAADEIVQYTVDLVRIPTVNPPGEAYDACAHFVGDDLARRSYDVEYIAAEGRAEHTARHPRINVVGTRRGGPGPVVHLNSHIDVVPAGDGWTVDPFGGRIKDGKIFGRGVCDMKAGLAASVFAIEAIARAGVALPGTVEISGTADEESGGFAGVAYLAETGRIRKGRTDFVIIPEPLNVDRICVGHRGVYWFEVTARGRIGHGSMPFLGVNAIEHMGLILDRIRRKFDTAATLVPKPEVSIRDKNAKMGIIYFGANSPAVLEALDLLERDGIKINALRIKAFPFSKEIAAFCEDHDTLFVVEQNRDAQMRSLLMTEIDVPGGKLMRALNYDGMPMTAAFVRGSVLKELRPAQAAAE